MDDELEHSPWSWLDDFTQRFSWCHLSERASLFLNNYILPGVYSFAKLHFFRILTHCDKGEDLNFKKKVRTICFKYMIPTNFFMFIFFNFFFGKNVCFQQWFQTYNWTISKIVRIVFKVAFFSVFNFFSIFIRMVKLVVQFLFFSILIIFEICFPLSAKSFQNSVQYIVCGFFSSQKGRYKLQIFFL